MKTWAQIFVRFLDVVLTAWSIYFAAERGVPERPCPDEKKFPRKPSHHAPSTSAGWGARPNER